MTDTQNQNAEAVAALAPETRPLTAGGKEYQVRRLETRQFWPILRAGLPIFEGLTALVAPASSPAADSPLGGSRPAGQAPEGIVKLLGPELAVFLQVLADHGERITEIVAVALDEKISTVGKWEPQETYLALRAIIETNRDFFTHRVAPLLGIDLSSLSRDGLAAAVSQATKALSTGGAGQTPSSS